MGRLQLRHHGEVSIARSGNSGAAVLGELLAEAGAEILFVLCRALMGVMGVLGFGCRNPKTIGFRVQG